MLFRINLNTIFTPIYTLVFPSGIRTLIVGVRVFNVTRSSDFKSSWKKKFFQKQPKFLPTFWESLKCKTASPSFWATFGEIGLLFVFTLDRTEGKHVENYLEQRNGPKSNLRQTKISSQLFQRTVFPCQIISTDSVPLFGLPHFYQYAKQQTRNFHFQVSLDPRSIGKNAYLCLIYIISKPNFLSL